MGRQTLVLVICAMLCSCVPYNEEARGRAAYDRGFSVGKIEAQYQHGYEQGYKTVKDKIVERPVR